MSDSAFEVESFLRVISWTVLIIYYLDILLECVSAEVVFIHQIHLSDTTVMKIYLYIFFELWSHFIQSSFFSSGSFLTGSDSVPDPFLQNQALLFHTIKFHIQKKFHRVFQTDLCHKVLPFSNMQQLFDICLRITGIRHSVFNKRRKLMREILDKRSFVLGMITAFSECIAGGCKRLALSPPLTHEEYVLFCEDACEIIEKHGLIHYHELNADLPDEERFEWILIAGKKETIDQYLKLRKAGYNPANGLDPFYDLLSYNEQESIHTGYDAYRTGLSANRRSAGW